MKTPLFFALGLAAVLIALSNCQQQTAEAGNPSAPEAPKEDPVKRGEYLVSILGCDDCHTPKNMGPRGPEPDMTRRFMGHPADETFTTDDKKKMISEQHVAIFSPGMTAAAGPWGVSYAANITPDDTGMGAWTEAQFLKAIREGKNKGMDGTRPILPPMPWPLYRNMTDDDLKAIYAYLKTVKPIKNAAPAPKQL